MRLHLYYIFTTVLVVVLTIFIFGVLISDAVLLRDNFERKEVKTAVVVDTTKVIRVKGIDVSHYQGDIPWNNLSTSIDFAICKASEGKSLLDTEFKANWANIKSSGRIRGAYHFYLTSDDPVTQANFFWKTVSDYEATDLPLILDIESASLRGTVTPEQLQKDILEFLNSLQEASGKTPIIYSNTSFATQYLNNAALARYPLWVAEYTSRDDPKIPSAWQEVGWNFWQKSDTYDLGKIEGDVDFDLFNGSREQLIQFISKETGSVQ